MARFLLNCEGADLVTHELVGEFVMIGRVPSNHIVIDHPTVSAQHAMLLRVGVPYWLRYSFGFSFVCYSFLCPCRKVSMGFLRAGGRVPPI